MLRNYAFQVRHPDGETSAQGVSVVSLDTQLAARQGLVDQVDGVASHLRREYCEQIRAAIASNNAINGKPLTIQLDSDITVRIFARKIPGVTDPIGFDVGIQDVLPTGAGASFQ
jgi:hypothetical protein